MARRNAWPEGGRGKTRAARRHKAHAGAALIGWAYRRDRKRAPAPVMRYLAAAGLSPAALRKYRGARKTRPGVLLAKRTHRSRKSGRPREAFKVRPFLVNPRRRGRRKVGRYARFVKSFSRKTGIRGRALMRAAARAWRGGRRAAANITLPGQVTFNRKRGKGRARGRRRNPVLPYMAFENRRGRGYRRNPVLPYASFNEAADDNPLAGVMAAAKQTISVDFWTDTVLPLGAGFIGSQFVGGLALSLSEKVFGAAEGIMGSVQRIGSRMLGSVAVSAAALFLPLVKSPRKRRDIAGKVLAGGLVSVLAAIIMEVFGKDTYEKMTGMADFEALGADLTRELKERIAQSVRGEIARAEAGLPGAGASAFMTTQDLSAGPVLGPGPRVGDMGAFVSTQDLQTAPTPDTPMVADLSAFSDSFQDMMLV